MTEKDQKILFSKEPYVVFVMDLLLSVLASIVSILLIRWVSNSMPGFYLIVLRWCLASVVATTLSAFIFGIYRISIEYITIRSTSRIVFMAALKDLLMYFALHFGILPQHTLKLAITLIVFDFLFTFLFMILIRGLIVFFMQTRRRSIEEKAIRHRVFVFGLSPKSIAQIPRLNDSSYYDVVGIIVTDRMYVGRIVNDRKVYCAESQAEFDHLCAQFGGIESVLFARDGDAIEQRDKLISWCITAGVNVLVSPRIENLLDDAEMVALEAQKKAVLDVYENDSKRMMLSDNDLEAFKRSLNQTFVVDGMSAFARTVKRFVDLIASFILLVVFSPLFLICCILIKKEDGGPVIYKQERIGRLGRPFNIYKFRSMRMAAEKMGPALYAGDDDPRLTKVGKFLRQHHLDELPQLFNVFKGDMAFVGYRPERKFYIDQILEKDPRYVYLFQIRPGVTSYATLRNGYTDNIEKMLRRLEFDLFYLYNRSWFFDIKILWLTFANIAFGKKF